MNYERLENGLKAHHFIRMTSRDRFGDLNHFECSCGSEFEDTEQLREHQNIHLRIFLGISEKQTPMPSELAQGAPTAQEDVQFFSYKDSNIRDRATAKAILLARIDEAQLLYDVTVNTPEVHKGLVQFMDRHLDDLRSKKVNGPAEPAPAPLPECTCAPETGKRDPDCKACSVPAPVAPEADLVEKWRKRAAYFKDGVATDWGLPKSDSVITCADELAVWLPAHDAKLRNEVLEGVAQYIEKYWSWNADDLRALKLGQRD